MDFRQLCSVIVIAVLLMGTGGDDTLMNRIGMVLAVCLLTELGDNTKNVTTLYFAYLMFKNGVFNDFNVGSFFDNLMTDNLFLGGMCQFYVNLSEWRKELPNPELPF